MTHKRFDFDQFDGELKEAIEEADVIDLAAKRCIEEDEKVLRPGDIGSVVCTPLFTEWFGPPDDAA